MLGWEAVGEAERGEAERGDAGEIGLLLLPGRKDQEMNCLVV